MRPAGNFHPEWGYLAPAPSFVRTVRIVMVAAAIGAIAGAAVVFSLVDRPAAEESVAARTLADPIRSAAQPIQSAAVAVSTPAAAEPKAQPTPQSPRSPPAPQPAADMSGGGQAQSETPSPASFRPDTPAAAESSTSSTVQRPAGITALAEMPAASDAAPPPADGASAAKKPAKIVAFKIVPFKSVQWGGRAVPRTDQPTKGPLALVRSFGPRSAY
jgi:hypothetical protein